MKIDKSAWIRITLLGIALLNQGLVMAGYSPLPLNDEDVEQFISLGFTVVTAILAGWKNNDITKEARLKTNLAEKELEKLNDNK